MRVLALPILLALAVISAPAISAQLSTDTPPTVSTLSIATAFPNHKVLAGFLVEDACSFFPAACGKAFYDLVTVENRTLEIWQDTVRK